MVGARSLANAEFTNQLEGYEGVTAQCHNCEFSHTGGWGYGDGFIGAGGMIEKWLIAFLFW